MATTRVRRVLRNSENVAQLLPKLVRVPDGRSSSVTIRDTETGEELTISVTPLCSATVRAANEGEQRS
jgi:hypothetical protein